MAKMIPNTLDDDNGSMGERRVFDALKKLPDVYTVFHSLRWNNRNEKNNVVYGESDFTVLHPEKGMIVIEVKSGGVECNNNEWFYIRTDTGEKVPMKNPLQQADKSKYYFVEKIKELLGDAELRSDVRYCSVDSAVWFPSISRRNVVGNLPIEYHPEIVLFENALDSPQKFIDGIYDFYNSKYHTNLTPDSVRKITEMFAPFYQVLPSLRSKKLEEDEVFERLTSEQNALLDYLEEQRVAVIQGAAGTGKTWMAIEKAKRLANEGRVLFLCFNQFLKQFLQNLKSENPKEFKNIDFYNLPQFACSKLIKSSVDQSEISQFLDDYYLYDWEYKHIIIDEGQDFNDKDIDRLSTIAELQDGSFYVFYDKNQFVHGKEFPDWLKNAECRLVLKINCRNTFSIADTSGKPLDVKPKVKNKSATGEMPRFYICNDRQSAIRSISQLIDKYRNNGIEYDQICILTLKTESNSILTGANSVGAHNISSERSKKSVLFTTARKFKGLESDAVIITDIDQNTFADDENKRLFYVGASRAKHNLDIIFIGDNNTLQKMLSLAQNDTYPTSIIGVARYLNVKPVGDKL